MNGLIRQSAWQLMLVIACCAATAGVRAEEPKSPAAAKVASADEISAWIKDLDAGRYRTREEATQRLLAAGAPVLDPLLVVANGDPPEPADRAVWIMRNLSRSRDNDLAL